VPETKVDFDKHEATVTFTPQPGAVTDFGKLMITGNEQVKEAAIRRQILISEGERYSEEILQDTTADIYRLRMFRAVTPRRVNLDDAPGTPLDIEFNVRERQPRTIEVAVGVSSVEQFRLGVTWVHRNVLGGAERFSASGKMSAIMQKAEASFHLPYVLAPRTSFTQTIFVNNFAAVNTDPTGFLDSSFNFEDPYAGYDWLSVGSVSRLEYRLTRKLTVFGGLEFSFNHFYNIKPDVDPNVETEDNLLLVQFVGLRWDLRDDVLDPTRGVYLDGRFDHSTTALLSDVNFAKILFEARYYRHLGWRFILATRFLIGAIQPYGSSDDIPQNVRFFAGGPGSVRGYAINRLGPLDNEGDPIGGNSRIEANVEFRYPILDNLQGAVFVDLGNVFESSFAYPLDELRYAVGVGIRYLTPVGPLRVDYGIVVDRRPGEDFGRLEFSIGQAF
jgi:outer membrane protein assembly complex protein YaeT